MESIGFDPQLVYFVLKPTRAYGEGGGEQLSVGKKTVREPNWGFFFFFWGGGGLFFFFFKSTVLRTKSEPGNHIEAKWSRG